MSDRIVLNVSWAELKAIADTDDLLTIRARALDSGDVAMREAFVFTPDIVYRCFLDGSVPEDVIECDTLANNQANLIQRVGQILDASGSSVWLTTHDFCDPCTWWQQSVRVVDESLVAVPEDSYRWQCANQNIIDLTHGRHLNEDDIAGGPDALGHNSPSVEKNQIWDLTRWFPGGHYLIPVLKDDQGTVLTRVNDFQVTLQAGEWRVEDYENGIIETGDPLGTAPSLSYHYATGNRFDIFSLPGKQYKVNMAEVNLRNADADTAAFFFEIVAAGGAYIGARRIYKNEKDVIAASVGAPRRWQYWDIYQWDYSIARTTDEDVRIPIKASADMAVRLYTNNSAIYQKRDIGGPATSMAITLYAVSFDE